MYKRQLSQSQYSIWMGQKLNPNIPLYNMAHAFTLKTKIEPEVFRKAFGLLLQNTDALRTVFCEEKDIPYQIVKEELDYSLEYLDFSNTSAAEITSWLRKRSKLTFDLKVRGFDTVLLKTPAHEYVWFLNIHHIITDATSSTILLDLMSNIYSICLENEVENSIDIPQFKAYLDYEEAQRGSEKHELTKSFWEDKVKDITPPNLYNSKNDQIETEAIRVICPLGEERSKQLQLIAQKSPIRSWTQDLTLFNIFSTLLFVYLHRVSGQKELSIGAPSHNRLSKAFKDTPGLFVEFFPLVVQLEDKDSFLDLLQRIKLETNNYLRYAQPGASSSKLNKSYNVVLNYINAKFSNFNKSPVVSDWIHPEHIDAGHSLRCHVCDMDNSGTLSVMLDFNASIFNNNHRENATQHFLTIIDAFIENVNAPIQSVPLVTNFERAKYLNNNFLGDKEDNQFILSTFENHAQNTPNAIALQFENETFTYQGLNKKANRLAYYLQKTGVKAGVGVALYNFRNIDYIVNILAVMKIGGYFIPIASNQPVKRIQYILENAECDYVLTNTSLKVNINDLKSINIIDTIEIDSVLSNESDENLNLDFTPSNLAYILYTSGSTGHPKGVLISNKALSNYIFWAKDYYNFTERSAFALCTSIGFDLTITSTFVPLVSGGRIVVYKEDSSGTDTAILDVIKDNLVDTIKLTPSHLTLFQDRDLSSSKIKTIIVGGEDFKVSLGKSIKKAIGSHVKIFNEYGPTEATVGCIVSEFNENQHIDSSIPIGVPVANMKGYLLDDSKNLVPLGVVGELYLSGSSLANGYLDLPELNGEKFLDDPFFLGAKMYKTGDLARVNESGEYEYLGRVDEQVKLRGYRIELSDIEANLNEISGIDNCAVVLTESKRINIAEDDVINCTICGLPSNYPDSDFDENGICHLCNAFNTYRDKAEKYFKTEGELKSILTANKGENPTYDCLSLLSGGKDSTYILAQLVSMGLKVLAFTLDNGYISNQAKDNINRIVQKLGVDHIYGETPHMNDIFIDSLNRHQNVCNGCFKTIYTLSTKIAMEKQIPFIVTGLSRGQFFETRLTEELFWEEELDVKRIDDTILEVRKLYHREQDAVKDLLDVSIFEEDEVFEKVQFVDFYRYSDVSLEDMLKFLGEKVDWVRPTDTGRSTNCLINQVGIYVHKKELGYSNYSFPYSWDVRLGHKTRDESLEEINEYIDEVEVKRIMKEIGYEESDAFKNNERLVAYYTGYSEVSIKVLKEHLSQALPEYMIPTNFKYLPEMPLTKNGKIDKKTLKSLNTDQLELETSYVAPRNEIDELIEGVWKEVLRLNKIGIKDNFIALGGHSLAAIRVTSRINEELEMEIPLNKVFNLPTIEEYSNYLERTMLELLEE